MTQAAESLAPAPPRRNLKMPMMSAGLVLALPAGLVLIFLYAVPLARLFALSFEGEQGMSLGAYERILGDSYGRLLIWNSLRLGLVTTALTLAVGYPAAFGLAFSRGALRSLFLASLFLPLAASVIVKAFAWSILLRSHGVVNETLIFLHLTNAPIRMIFTQSPWSLVRPTSSCRS
jgi:putative spermidine/putrescine transport system permease protein